MVERFSMRSKLIAGGVLTALGLAVPTLWLFPRYRAFAYQRKLDESRNMIRTVWGVASYFGDLSAKGLLSREDAQAQAKKVIAGLRYEGNNYFWVNDIDCRMVMHPTKPEMNGQSMSSYADPNGFRMFVEFVRVARTRGEGEVYYLWPKPGRDEPVRKLSYVKLYAPWGWVVGTGSYLDDVSDELNSAFWSVYGSLAFFMVLSVGGAVWASAYLTRPLQHVSSDLIANAEEIEENSRRMLSGSRELAEGASHQADAIEQSSVTTQEIEEVSRRAVNSSAAAASEMARTTRLVEESTARLTEMTACMQDIESSSGKIASIIQAIDGIAFQTNILALNAAVEAARAGESGLGFAVVADEVRNLAGRSAQAARDTAGLIEESRTRTGLGVSKLTEEADAIRGINAAAHKVKELIEQVSHGTQEQSNSIARMAAALAEIRAVTQTTVSSAQQTSETSQDLTAKAGAIKRAAAELETLVHGAKPAG